MNQQPDQHHDAATGGPGSRGRLLVAVDVDGTLLNTELEDVLRPREAAAIRNLCASGHVCALCTGRNRRSVDGLLASSGDDLAGLPLILLNGAVVMGGTPRRQLFRRELARDVVRRLVEIMHAHDALAMVYDTEERGEGLFHEDRSANEILSRYLERRRARIGACHAVADLVQHLPATALEVGTIDTTEKVAALTEQIERSLGDRVKVVNTETLLARETYRWVEVYHRDCSKGQGALLLASHYGIAAGNIVAVGDNYNDLELFAVAGHSVAMGNAPAMVRKAADRVAPPVTRSGAAIILEEIADGRYPNPGPDPEG